jgi:probable HAF family extracellular repeat protein
MLRNGPVPPGWTLETATAINNSGQIVGWGINGSGQTDAFLLTPASATRKPASLTLFALGIAGMAGYAWRRRKRPAA